MEILWKRTVLIEFTEADLGLLQHLLTIITKRSVLDVAAVIDPSLVQKDLRGTLWKHCVSTKFQIRKLRKILVFYAVLNFRF